MFDRQARDEDGRDRKQARRLERGSPSLDTGAPVRLGQEIEAGPMAGAAEQSARDAELLSKLTSREREVLILTARGLKVKEIALAIGCGQGTVWTHRASIARKTQVSGKVEMTLFACRTGLVQA